MSFKRGKGKDEEEYISDDAPPKKTSKKNTSGDYSGVFICDISKNRRVSVRNWQGKVFVDIREFYMKDGKQMPGKKEMSFKRGKGKDEEEYISDDAPPKKTSKKNTSGDDSGDENSVFICDISKNRRVSVRNWQGKVFVDIREFYMKDGKQMPGKKGISLSMDQWKELCAHVEEIDKAVA